MKLDCIDAIVFPCGQIFRGCAVSREAALETLEHEMHETAPDPKLLDFTRLFGRVQLDVLLCLFHRITGRTVSMSLEPDLSVGFHATAKLQDGYETTSTGSSKRRSAGLQPRDHSASSNNEFCCTRSQPY